MVEFYLSAFRRLFSAFSFRFLYRATIKRARQITNPEVTTEVSRVTLTSWIKVVMVSLFKG